MTPRRSRQGFTLLEVLLTTALTVVLLGLVTLILDRHLKAVNLRRTRVEEAQIARAVLRMIGNDLRASVRYGGVDFSSVGDLATGGINMDDLGGVLGDDVSEEDVESAAADIASVTSAPSIPGLYGNQYEMLLDVSRLPRVDQYAFDQTTISTTLDLPSDVKTVAYYLVTSNGNQMTTEASSGALEGSVLDEMLGEPVEQTGLVRRAVDRAVTRWAMENGDFESLDQYAEVIAPEVVQLEFRYYDGNEWLLEWDSLEQQGLPLAVEIAIAIAHSEVDPIDTDAASLVLGEENNNVVVYRLTVDLPAAEPLDVDPLAEEEEETSEPVEDDS